MRRRVGRPLTSSGGTPVAARDPAADRAAEREGGMGRDANLTSMSGSPPAGPRYDLPMVEEESRPHWDGLADGRLVIKRCNSCGEHHHYPRPFCPSCWSEDVEWVEASGDATLYTWSLVHVNDLPPFGQQVPYVAAVVDLAEGPRLMTRIVGAEPDSLECGMAVRFGTAPLTDELSMAVFRPA